MTISSVQTILPTRFAGDPSQRKAPKPPPLIYNAKDHPFKGFHPPQPEGYEQSKANPESSAIVIDNGETAIRFPSYILYMKETNCCSVGSNLVKAGWSFDKTPRLVFPPVMSRYRDRKLNRACQFIGHDAYVDATTRGQLRNAFDPGSSVVGNWDVMEGLLDYTFIKLGVDGGNGGVDRPVVMTEPIANLNYPRRSGFGKCPGLMGMMADAWCLQ